MDSMTLEQMSNIGELVGAILIIVSLIYVSRQIAQNNRAQRVAAIQSHNDTYHKNLALLADHADIWIAGLKNFSDMTPQKRVEFGMLIQSIVRHIEQAYMIKKEGLLSERTYNTALGNLSSIMSYPGAQDWWLTRRETFDSEFSQSLESWINENSPKDVYSILSDIEGQ